MKYRIFRVIVYFSFFFCLFSKSGISQQQKSQKDSPKKTIIDNFDANPMNEFTGLHSPRFVFQAYEVYYANASVKITKVAVSETDSALRIEYELPEMYSWGNWLSIRCELSPVLNLKNYNGLKLNLRAEETSNAMLRLSLVDVINIDERGNDELWWFDSGSDVLMGPKGQWQELTLPFGKFYESYGEGTRHNDSELDLSKISAYEINIVSKPNTHPKGTIILNSLVTF